MKNKEAKPSVPLSLPASSRYLWSSAILLILCSALILRLWGLREKSLWLDESLGVLFAASKAREFFPLLSLDVHPPFYFILLRILIFLSKNPVFWRLFSVVCGTASLAGFYFALRIRAHKGALFLSLILLSISPVMIHYSQEIRMYAFLVLLTTLAFWSCLFFAEKPGLTGFVLFCFFAVLSIYTHYFAGVFIIGCLVFLAWERGRFHRNLMQGAWDALRAGILIAVLYLPWMPVFFRHLYSSSLGGKHAQSHFSGFLQTMTEYFTRFFGGVMPWVPLEKTILFHSNPHYLGSLGWILFFLFIMILFSYGIYILRKESRLFRCMVSILAVGAIITFIHLTLKGRFYPRCFIIYLPLVFYILARGIIAIPMRLVRLSCMVYLSLCLLIPALFYLTIDIRDVSLPLSRILKEETSPDDVILHTGKFSYFPLKIYLPERRQFLADTPYLLLQERMLAKSDLIDDSSRLSSARRVWLIVEYWGTPTPSDNPDFWLNNWLGSSWLPAKPFFLSMGVKKCTVIRCDRKNR